MSTDELVTWWTPSGFIQGPPPPSYLKALAAAEVDWIDGMRGAGYAMDCSSEDDVFWSSQVWDHRDGHLLVVLVERTQFLVDKVHAAAFWTGLFPAIRAAENDERRTYAIEKQSKSLIAWIRHGHGTHVVAEDGSTLEENQRERERLRQHQVQQRRAKS